MNSESRKPKADAMPKPEGRRLTVQPQIGGAVVGRGCSNYAPAPWSVVTRASYSPQVRATTPPIPKGLQPSARGCAHRATPGGRGQRETTPTGLCRVRPEAGRNPVGVGAHLPRLPRVARRAQPWAEGRNPVGIQDRTLGNSWVMERSLCHFSSAFPQRQRAAALQDAGARSLAPSATANTDCLRMRCQRPTSALANSRTDPTLDPSDFELRTSVLFRLSAFGLRASSSPS